MADAAAQGSYAGFLDGFLNWYHELIGIRLEAREERPNDAFLYRLDLPDGVDRTRRPSDLFLGDVRLAAGLRFGPHLQTLALVTLPTATGPAGYGRGVPAAGLITTVRAPLAEPLIYEGSLGLGYTPTHGDLEPVPAYHLRVGQLGHAVAILGAPVTVRESVLSQPVLPRHDHPSARPAGAVARLRLDAGDERREGVADRHDRGHGAERPGDRHRVPAGSGPLTVRCRPDPP